MKLEAIHTARFKNQLGWREETCRLRIFHEIFDINLSFNDKLYNQNVQKWIVIIKIRWITTWKRTLKIYNLEESIALLMLKQECDWKMKGSNISQSRESRTQVLSLDKDLLFLLLFFWVKWKDSFFVLTCYLFYKSECLFMKTQKMKN